MKLKRTTAILLSVILLFGAVAPAVSAAEPAADSEPSAAVTALEKVGGMLGNLLGHMLKIITFTDESRIRKAEPRDAAGQKSDTALFTGAAEQSLSAETWRMTELTFESEKTYADPFRDVTLNLLLWGNGRLYTVPGFWDGGNTWRVRFVCPTAGKWQCLTVCSDTANDALHGRTAAVSCAAYSGDLAVYQHGFVTTRYGEKYLTYEDGTPFFYLGDTHWNFGTEPTEVVAAVSAKRAAQGFTVWQSEPNGDFTADYDLTDGVTDNDITGLHMLDERYAVIANRGLVHANAEFFFPPQMNALIAKNGGYSDTVITGRALGKRITSHELSEQAKTYLEALSRYWVARFGSYPVIWTLGQEVDNDFYNAEYNKGEWDSLNHPYRLVAGYVAKYDPYDQPITAHQESTGNTVAYGNGGGTGEVNMIYYPGGSPSAFRKTPSHTMYAAQWSPKLTGRDDCVSSKDYWYNGQGKPVVNYEGRYCYYWTKDFGARMQGWAAYLNGLYGYGWGGQGTWYYTESFNPESPSDDGADTVSTEEKTTMHWQDAMEYASSYQTGYMRRFLEDAAWYDLIPRFNNWAYFVPAANVYAYCASNKANTEMVVYFYSFSDLSVAERSNTERYGGVATGTVGSLTPFGQYSYRWFDPITGEYIAEGTFKASGLGTWFAGIRPAGTDLALWIIKE